MLWFWILAAPAAALALLSLLGEKNRLRFYLESLSPASAGADPPPATLIVPVKGPEEGLRDNLASLASQDYPDYELLVAARSAADIPDGVVPECARVVIAGDGAHEASEKIHNLLAAVAAARDTSQVLAFADSDGRVPSGWLRALIAPLARQGVGAATGYRWHLPEPADFWSLLRGVWNAVIAGRLGPGANDFAWGGAMAIRKETFFRCGVPDAWQGVVSDDFALSRAVRSAGLEIHFAPGALTPTLDHTSAREFLAWIERQMVITRVCHPRLWWTAFVAHLLYCAGALAALAAIFLGRLEGAVALAVIWGTGMWKGARRAKLARVAMPAYDGWFRRHGWVHTWWTPLATWVWIYSLAASALGNTIEWRGRHYRLAPAASKSPEKNRERQHAAP